MMRSRKWERVAVFVAQSIGAAALVALMLQVSANGVLRRLAGVQIPLTLELTEWWYMPLLAGAGIAMAAVQREHFFVDLVFEQLAVAGRKVLVCFASAVALLLTGALAFFSLMQAIEEASIGRYEPVTGLPIWPLYFVIPLAFATYSAVLLSTLYRLIFCRDFEELGEKSSGDVSTEAVS